MKQSMPGQTINRRDFLRTAVILGSLTTVTSLLEACAPVRLETPTTIPVALAEPTQALTAPAKPTQVPTVPAEPTATPSPTTIREEGVARVAFVKTRDRVEGVQRVLDLLGLNPVQGKKVVLKPNFNSAHPAPGSTHNDVLRTLIQELWDMGARTITVADRSGMGDTRQVMEQKGVLAMAGELGFETLVFDEMAAEDWVMIQPPAGHWERGFPFARPCLEAEALVQTCNLKTHRFGGHFTMSLKNAVGMVARLVPGDAYNYMTELHSSPARQRLMIAEINAAYTPALIVMDGVQAFTTGGPDTGSQVWAEVMLASTDRVAIDAVGVAVLRHFGTTREVSQGAIFQQEQIARAVGLGLGVDGPEKIKLITGDPDSEAYAAQIQEILARG